MHSTAREDRVLIDDQKAYRKCSGRQLVSRFQCFASSDRFCLSHSRSTSGFTFLRNLSSRTSPLSSIVSPSSWSARSRSSFTWPDNPDTCFAKETTHPGRFCTSLNLAFLTNHPLVMSQQF